MEGICLRAAAKPRDGHGIMPRIAGPDSHGSFEQRLERRLGGEIFRDEIQIQASKPDDELDTETT